MRSILREPRCVWIFHSHSHAIKAIETLRKGGYPCYITEDGFGELTLKDLGMTPRFRLYVQENDINAAGEFLAKKLPTRIHRQAA